MKIYKFALFSGLLGALVWMLAACQQENETHAAATASITPWPAPQWELTDVNGQQVRSSDFKGKVVILDFWATWCPPCRAEIPGFIELQNKYGSEGLVVIGVSVDQKGPSVVKPFMEATGVNYPMVMADENIDRAFGGVQSIPTTFIIDREGRVVSKHVGFAPKETFEKEIKPLLNAKPKEGA